MADIAAHSAVHATSAVRAAHSVRARHEFRGMRTTEHYFTVPLDHFGSAEDSDAETITVFAREYVSAEHSETAAKQLPWLVYLQGGPGGRGNRFTSLGGWSKAASKDFRILMLDQRGAWLSTPANRNTLPLRGDAQAQARYLEHFRADSAPQTLLPWLRTKYASRHVVEELVA